MSIPISTSEARGAVEKWLLQVQDVMLMSVRDVVEAAVEVPFSSHFSITFCPTLPHVPVMLVML